MAIQNIAILLLGLTMNSIKCDLNSNGMITSDATAAKMMDQMNVFNANTNDGPYNEQSLSATPQIRLEPHADAHPDQHIHRQLHEPNNFDVYLMKYVANNVNATVIRSSPAKDNMNETFEIPFDKVQDLEIVIHLLNINPYVNYLLIESWRLITDVFDQLRFGAIIWFNYDMSLAMPLDFSNALKRSRKLSS